jgi:anaerobic selenocysteine-containing dehydrogenase
LEDISHDAMCGEFRTIEYEEKCIEPLGESKSDYEIVGMIAERLGLLDKYTGGKSISEWIKFGFDTSGVTRYIDYDEFKQKGYFVIPTDPEWERYPAGLRKFHDDPENNPLTTPSGKLEFYSQRLADKFPGDEERPPYPKWIPYGKTHQESLQHPRAKQFPLLVMSNHPRWGVHAQHEDVTWFREVRTCKVRGPDGYQYHPVWLNPTDAANREIEDGDVVRIYNERGGVLAGAYVTERIMPGVISIDHGSKLDPIVPGVLDRGGAINTITPRGRTSKNTTGMAVSGFLAEMERVNLGELRKKYPKAFKRPFHPTAGLCVDYFTKKEH